MKITWRPVPSLLAILAAVGLTACGGSPSVYQDSRFTIAVLPDTQNYVDFVHQRAEGFPFDARDMFLQQMQNVVENVQSQGGEIAFVSHLGDVWQHGSLEIDPAHAREGFRALPNPPQLEKRRFLPTSKVQ